MENKLQQVTCNKVQSTFDCFFNYFLHFEYFYFKNKNKYVVKKKNVLLTQQINIEAK